MYRCCSRCGWDQECGGGNEGAVRAQTIRTYRLIQFLQKLWPKGVMTESIMTPRQMGHMISRGGVSINM